MSLYAAQAIQGNHLSCPSPCSWGRREREMLCTISWAVSWSRSGWMTAGRRQAYQTLVQSLFCSCSFLWGRLRISGDGKVVRSMKICAIVLFHGNADFLLLHSRKIVCVKSKTWIQNFFWCLSVVLLHLHLCEEKLKRAGFLLPSKKSGFHGICYFCVLLPSTGWNGSSCSWWMDPAF